MDRITSMDAFFNGMALRGILRVTELFMADSKEKKMFYEENYQGQRVISQRIMELRFIFEIFASMMA